MRFALPSRGRAIALCVFAGATVVVSVALLVAAVLAPAPPAALPFVAIVCIGCPLAAGHELPDAVRLLRGDGAREPRALRRLRRELDRLPETRHPLGL